MLSQSYRKELLCSDSLGSRARKGASTNSSLDECAVGEALCSADQEFQGMNMVVESICQRNRRGKIPKWLQRP
jgi:hypothetical protein